MLLSSSKIAQRAAAARQMTVTRVAASTAVRRVPYMLHRRETEECPRVEDGEVQKIASK